MRIVLLLCCVTASSNLWAQSQKPIKLETTKLNLESAKQKIGYVLGQNIGGSLRRDGVDIDIEAFTAGLADALSGVKSRLSDAERERAMSMFQQEMRKKERVRRRELALARISADPKQKAIMDKNVREGTAFLKANAKKEGVKVTESGLQYKVLRAGKGPKPTSSNQVKTHYHGTLTDGTVFDSSVQRDQPATFGVTQVIPGWTEALQLMPVGSKWRLFIPAGLAYDLTPRPGGPIGPGAVLIFDIELLEIVQ